MPAYAKKEKNTKWLFDFAGIKPGLPVQQVSALSINPGRTNLLWLVFPDSSNASSQLPSQDALFCRTTEPRASPLYNA